MLDLQKTAVQFAAAGQRGDPLTGLPELRAVIPVQDVAFRGFIMAALHQGQFHQILDLLNRGVLVAEAGLHHGKQLLKFILRGRFIHAGEGLFHGIYNFLRIICFNSTAALQNLHFVILRTIIGYIVLFTVSLFKAHALPICSPASDAKWPQKQ